MALTNKEKNQAVKYREMVANAEKNGGSFEEIKKAVIAWDNKATLVEISIDGHIAVNGSVLSDEEFLQWFFWTQGAASKRN